MRILFVVVVLLLSSCGSQHQLPKIAMDSSWYPLNFGFQAAYINGFTKDLLLEIARQEDAKFELVSSNSEDLFLGLQEGKYDAILTSLPPYTFNLAKYDFSQNFLELGPVLIVGEKSSYKKLSQIKGETVGIVEEDLVGLVLAKYPSLAVRSYKSVPDLLMAVVDGEIVGALLDRLPAVQYVSDLYDGELKIVSSPLECQGLHLIAKKGKQEELVVSFDRTLKSLKKKKKLQALLKKWKLHP